MVSTASLSREPVAGSALSSAAWWVLLAFVASIPAEAAIIIPGYGSLSRAIGAVMLLIATLDLSAQGRTWPGGVAVWCVWTFSAWALLSIAWSLEPTLSVDRAITYLQLALMFSVILSYADSTARIKQLLWAYLVGVVITCVSLFVQFRAINFALAITEVRVSAFGFNPNEQGLTLVAGLPWALYFARSQVSRILRVAALAAVVCIGIGTVLTASRAAFVALALTGVGMAWMMADARAWTKLLVCLTLTVGGLLAYVLVPEMIWARLFTVGSKVQAMDLNNRVPAWRAGIEYYIDAPLGGVGAGAFEAASARVISIERSSHNTFLGVLVETGLVGACVFAGLLACVVTSATKLPKVLRRAMLSTLVPMFVGMVVTAWDYRKVPWLFFALTIAMCRAQRPAEAGGV